MDPAYTGAARCYGERVPRRGASMAKKAAAVDAITLLKADHKKVRGLLAALEKTTERSAERRTGCSSRSRTSSTSTPPSRRRSSIPLIATR
jgi:hypothetical protein